MGGFMIFRITFKEKKEMSKFIRKYHPIVLVEDKTRTEFVAWRYLWKHHTVIYFMGFMGYDEPLRYKKELKGKIKYFDYITINDLNSRWGKDKNDRKII